MTLLSKAMLVEIERKRLAREQAEDDRKALVNRQKVKAMIEATEFLRANGIEGLTGRKGPRTDNYGAHKAHKSFHVVPMWTNGAFKRGSYR